jgi:glutamate dehydrogenase
VTADALTPSALIQAILRCETDLLWFGGIGTYIRESQETDEQVGDRSNDAIRVTAPEVRAKVIGEGANLGVTQRGRIELDRNGVRLNTDFIDNSAGVNTSDQEVNIKIALAPGLKSGKLAIEARNALLAQMSDDVAAAVLNNNYQQGLALSLAERTSRRDISHLAQLARQLDERGLVVRKLEVLPSGAEFAQRAANNSGMTRPELAVLMSWAKIALNAELLAGPVPDEPSSRELLFEYFPAALRERFGEDIRSHRLGREIIAARITNSIINRGGPAVVVRLAAETGRSTADVANAFMTTRNILSLTEVWAEIDKLDGKVPGQLQLDLYQRVQDLLIEETANLLGRQAGRSFMTLLADYRPAVEHLSQAGMETTTPRRRELIAREADRLASFGVPSALAARIAGLDIERQAFEFADRAASSGSSVVDTARAFGLAAEYLGVEELEARAATLEPTDEYEARATAEALSTIRTAHAVLADRVLREKKFGDPAQWASDAIPGLHEAKSLVERIVAEHGISVARLAVAAAALRSAGLVST